MNKAHYYCLQFFLMALPFWANAQLSTLRFEKLDAEDGLTQNTITGIVQDQKGFVWIATQDGLNKYDGFTNTAFRHNKYDSNSISHNILAVLCLDKNTLWIGSDGMGVSKLDLETEKFTNYVTDSIKKHGMSIYDIYDDDSILWLATDDGLFTFHKEKETYTYIPILAQLNTPLSSKQAERVYAIEEFNQEQLYLGLHAGLVVINKSSKAITHTMTTADGLPHFRVKSLLKDHKARLWVGTYNGLMILHPNGKKEYIQTIGTALPDPIISNIFQDNNHNFWIGTYGGLVQIQEDTDRFTFQTYTYAINDKFGLSNNRIQSIYEDRAGTLWFGTYFGGISKYDQSRNKFNLLPGSAFSSPIVRAICEDVAGNTWVGTQDGLNRIDGKTGEISNFYKGNTTSSLGSNIIRSLLINPKENSLWIGTADAGISIYHFNTKRFERLQFPPKLSNIAFADIRTMHYSADGSIWIGTSGNGLVCLKNPKTAQEKWIVYDANPSNPNHITSNSITAIHEQYDSLLWFSTWNGLIRLNLKTNEIKSYLISQYPSLATNSLKSVNSDQAGKIWIATAGGGIQLLEDQEAGIFKTYDQSSGLPNNYVYSILADDHGSLWASTNRGLSKFNPATNTFRNYDMYDGLQDNEFNTGAYAKTKSGQFYFGGIKGLNFFYPEEITDNQAIPQPVITSLKIFDKDIKVGKLNTQGPQNQYHLPQHIAYCDQIEIDHNESVFSLYFSAVHYANQYQNKFAYKLLGFDEQWRYTDAQAPFASYTNLPAQTYTFQVKACNNDGIWNETPTNLTIIIHPPFWQLWYVKVLFISGGILFLALLVSRFYRYRLKQIAHQKQVLEEEVSVRTKELREKNQHLKESQEELKKSNEELEDAYRKLTESEFQLRISKEEVKQYNIELLATNENLNEMTQQLEYSLRQEKQSREMAENAHAELKAAEVQLIQREKMAALGTLTAGIAHEVNNPINYVMSGVYALDIIVNDLHQILTHYKQLEQLEDIQDLKKELQRISKLKQELQLEEAHDDCLTILGEIRKGADKVLLIVKGLLNFARLNESSQKMADIHEGLDSTLLLLNDKIQKQQITVKKAYQKSIPRTYCQPSELNQAFMSVINNALEASEKHSSLVIKTALTDHNEIKISIQDFGEGIDADVMPHIFDPFFTTKDVGKGKGLGLASSLGIIQRHGGQIEVESQKGEGTTVLLTIPVAYLGTD